MKPRGQRYAASAVVDRPFFGADDEGRANTSATGALFDDERRQPGNWLAGVNRLKKMNSYDAEDLSIFILGDEHRRARPRVKLVNAVRDIGGFGRIPQLSEQAAERGGILARYLSDSQRVHLGQVSAN